MKRKFERDKVRFAVVGLGYFAQACVLPAFQQTENAELVGLVSQDRDKLTQLGAHYDVPKRWTYREFDNCLRSDTIDALYIALPNSLHYEYALRALESGVHVICEKPLAISSDECKELIAASIRHSTKLMTAYRLHYEESMVRAMETVYSGELGDPRIFNSMFGFQIAKGNSRSVAIEQGGGPLFDLGVYCINTARHVFRDEPHEVLACTSSKSDPRFSRSEEMTSVTLRFPQERVAQFVCSFGSAAVNYFQVVGTAGTLIVEPAFDFACDVRHKLTVGEKVRERSFEKGDQIAAEIEAFSQCIISDLDPDSSGYEGLADVRIIEAVYESVKKGRGVKLEPFAKVARPTFKNEIRKAPSKMGVLVKVESPR